ncbi:S-adenosyl-L-methionine-dependent methyltransferase [Coniochaeta sp. 2T2.1]|nr:S-adenosyl-L-methionine-dependent methyltransferase [Coniochaeta sp. 2T2.1]
MLANEHPASDVLGTDLSPIQPEYVPPNCRFEVDDAEDVWVFNDKFDYIHSRYMVAAFSDWPAVFRSCYGNLSPGGWAEFQEYYVEFQSVDDSLAGTALERWNKLIMQAVEKTGRHPRCAAKFRSQMVAAGFADVVERKFALPGNAWAKGEREKMLGLMQMTNMLDGLHGMTMQLFTRILGWSVEQVEVFLVNVRNDVRNKDIHFYYIV